MDGINTDVNFNFSYAPGVTDEQILGFEIAGDIWSQHLVDSYRNKDLEINIYVEATDEYLPDNVVGGSFPAIATGIKYNKIYDAIQDDITTDVDSIVADSLLDKNKIDALVGAEVIDKNFKTHVTTANMKALGLTAGDSTESAQIGDRRSEVEESILRGEAYSWGRASSGGGFWWGRASSGGGFWQESYFIEVESTIDSATGETHHHTPEFGQERFWSAVENRGNWVKDNWVDNWWERSSGDNWWERSWRSRLKS